MDIIAVTWCVVRRRRVSHFKWDQLFSLSHNPILTKHGGNLPGQVLQVKFEDDLSRSKVKVAGVKIHISGSLQMRPTFYTFPWPNLNQTGREPSWVGPPGQVRRWPLKVKGQGHRSKITKNILGCLVYQMRPTFFTFPWLNLNQTGWEPSWVCPTGQVRRWPLKVKGQGHRSKITKNILGCLGYQMRPTFFTFPWINLNQAQFETSWAGPSG